MRGGEGALVAAGGSPLGLGGDVGGSLRNPANYNGIVSMKPTTGRLNDMGRLEIFAGQEGIISQVGPLARTVADAELGHKLANDGRELRDSHAVDVRGLRIGFYEQLGSFRASPALARATREAAALLADLGAQVVHFDPPRVDDAMDVFYGILSADRGRGAQEALGKGPRDRRVAALLDVVSLPRWRIALIERLLALGGQRGLIEIVRNYGYGDARHYWKLIAAANAYKTLFATALDVAEGGPLDALVCPPGGLPALRHGASGAVSVAGPYAPLYNTRSRRSRRARNRARQRRLAGRRSNRRAPVARRRRIRDHVRCRGRRKKQAGLPNNAGDAELSQHDFKWCLKVGRPSRANRTMPGSSLRA